MNKLKKSLALIATLAIASTALVACGGDSSTADSSSKEESSKTEESKEDSKEESSEESSEAEANTDLTDEGDKVTIVCWNKGELQGLVDNFCANTDYDASKFEVVSIGENGGEAREKYTNYFSGDEDVDLFILEADWILEYVNGDHALPLSEVGFSESDFDGCYDYTVAIGKDDNGVLKAASWQATPGAYAYRTDLAEEYLGVKTPDEMQKKVKDWDTFTETAKEVLEKSGGKTAMADTLGGMWQVWQYNRSNAWTDSSDNLVIDDFCKDFAELAKTYWTEGYVTKESQWDNDGWYPIGQNGGTMGYFFCTWCLGDGAMLSNAEGGEDGATYGKYNICAGPSAWAWGGSWFAVNKKCDNMASAHDFIKYFTMDEAGMESFAREKNEFVNSPSVMKKIADDASYGNALLGGQNQAAVLYEAAGNIDMDGKITKFDAQIKDAFNNAAKQYAMGDIASYDDMIEKFKDDASMIQGLNVD